MIEGSSGKAAPDGSFSTASGEYLHVSGESGLEDQARLRSDSLRVACLPKFLV